MALKASAASESPTPSLMSDEKQSAYGSGSGGCYEIDPDVDVYDGQTNISFPKQSPKRSLMYSDKTQGRSSEGPALKCARKEVSTRTRTHYVQLGSLIRDILDWGGEEFDPQKLEGVATAAKRNRAKVDELAETLPTDASFWKEFPDDPWGLVPPVIDGMDRVSTCMAYVDIVSQRHHGELKEISHGWIENLGPVPSGLCSKQVALTHISLWDRTPWSHDEQINNAVLCYDRKANKYYTRKSQVFGIGDLWGAFGQYYTAKALHEAFDTFPTLVMRAACCPMVDTRCQQGPGSQAVGMLCDG
jgi:hypothetical protein